MKKATQKKKKKSARRKSEPSSRSNKRTSNKETAPRREVKEKQGKTYPVVSTKEPEKREEGGSSLVKYARIAGQFLRESKMELKKVKWPTRKELLASTAMVIFLVLFVAFFLGLIDFGLIKIIKNLVG